MTDETYTDLLARGAEGLTVIGNHEEPVDYDAYPEGTLNLVGAIAELMQETPLGAEDPLALAIVRLAARHGANLTAMSVEVTAAAYAKDVERMHADMDMYISAEGDDNEDLFEVRYREITG